MPGWLLPSVAATLIVLVAVPRLRVRALEASPTHPGSRPTVPEAGVALILAVLGGLLFQSSLRNTGALLFVVAALLGAIGLHRVGPSAANFHLAAVAAAAVLAVVLGVAVPETGSDLLNVLLTVAWVVFVTNGFAVLGQVDGVAAAVGAVASLAVFGVAVIAGQPVVAAAAIATAAACLTFLIYNRPPAWVAIGPSGSLFLGFILAILSLSVEPGRGVAERLLLPLLILAVPVVVTGGATAAQLKQATSRPRERLLGPTLVTRDLSAGRVLLVLALAEAAMGALAVILAGRSFPAFVTPLVGGAVLGALRAIRISAHMGVAAESEPAKPRRVARAVLLVSAAFVVLSVPAVLSLVRVEAPAKAGQAAANRAAAAIEGGDASAAVAEFERAATYFAAAKRRISGPLPELSMVVPVLSANVSATKALVTIGEELSRGGSAVGKLAAPNSLPIVNGAVVLDDLHSLIPALASTSAVIERSQRRLNDVQPALLVPPLADAVHDLSALLDDYEDVLKVGAESVQLLPGLLGEDAPKRYFLAFQNNSELRGTGGFIGNWGELVAEEGQLRLERFGRLGELQALLMGRRQVSLPDDIRRRWGKFGMAENWQQVNMSPDFPATARVIDILYAQSGGQPLDGVIAIDPVGLSALLGLTGPVTVPTWPEPITSANVVDVTLVQAYERFPGAGDAERIAFLADVARAATEAFTRLRLGSARQLVTSLSGAVRGRHLMVHTTDHRAEALVRKVGADGAVPALQGDALLVVNQNFAGNKIDTYLHRSVRYDVELDPRGATASVSGRGEVALTNALPSLALPESVVGPYLPHFRKGENRTYVSLYGPFLTGDVAVDGERVDTESFFELGRRSRSLAVSLDAGQTKTVGFRLQGEVELGDRTWYRLDLLRQPTLNADTYDVTVTVPPGWRVTDVRGAEATTWERRVAMHVRTDKAETLWVKVEPTGMNRVWDRLLA